jgi:valyl-tRNA synthetase
MSTDPPANGADGKPKTAKQLQKEAEKAKKLAKFLEKQEKQEALKQQQKVKPQKAVKAKVIVEYTSDTKPGEKKGWFFR